MFFFKMDQKVIFCPKTAMTMPLKNSKQNTKPFHNHLSKFGLHTHQLPINCIQSCCYIHMLCLHNNIFIVITMVALIHMQNDHHGNDGQWCGYRSGPWFENWITGPIPIIFWTTRNQYFH